MPSAMMDRAELPVQMNKTLWVCVFMWGQQQPLPLDWMGIVIGLPRGVGAQQALASAVALTSGVGAGASRKVGMVPRV